MIKCKKCKRQTQPGETTGKLNVMVYNNPKEKSEGKRISSSKITCNTCSGEKLRR